MSFLINFNAYLNLPNKNAEKIRYYACPFSQTWQKNLLDDIYEKSYPLDN